MLLKATRTHDENLTHQAKDKFSNWLQNNKDHSNKKLVAKVLRSRADAYMMLGEKSKAISDYQESIQYDPVASLQLLICHFKQEQGNSSNLQPCYVKAVDLFYKQKISTKNSSFLLARILSGDKIAITEYRNLLKTLTKKQKTSYEMEAQVYLDDVTYEEILK
ncbi:tetratricopeptide repeat protein [Commensalibacter oyaizuii]|uniref:Tetratricopeptide repeat protein n=1 Tax=Commensalibacter oyaizuii TaxID=3043873 RepID=A0ABT6Q2D3_9PROT|nr:tetratricopeptide repeat protein [Commensalibacter sp. TBRC 16381]MDI2091282.1 tetratricopeptide repeat protein [Commensalibacter sp. TBRC 16381]